MSDQLRPNPFATVKATDFSDQEILDYWVDLEVKGESLLALLQPREVMPVFLLGGKGSGKTHILRFSSTRVQSKKYLSLRETIANRKTASVYIAAEGINPERFKAKGQPEEAWSAIFAMYFELWLAINLLHLINDAFSETEQISGILVEELSALFRLDFETAPSSLAELIRELETFRKSVDHEVENAPISRDLSNVVIPFSAGDLVFGFPRVFAKHISELEHTLFSYLIDEAENFSAEQQKFINTLIRYRKGKASIKVGARLYGIKTFDTTGEEPIKYSAEFESIYLDQVLRANQREYHKLAHKILTKRLQGFGHDPKMDIDAFFEVIDQSDHWKNTSVELVQRRDLQGSQRPYFKALGTTLSSFENIGVPLAQEIIQSLTLQEHPYLEKSGVFMLYKRWPKDVNSLLPLANEIGEANIALANGGKRVDHPFKTILNHYGNDILAQLYRDCQRRVPYAGLENIINMSQGIPRNFLSIMKNIYRRSAFVGEKPFDLGRITIQSQSDGIRDGADWFWEDAQPGKNGDDVRKAVEAIALLFRTIRYSDSPSECSLCAFSVKLADLTENARDVLKAAENWSYLIRVPTGQKNRNNESIDAKYQLSAMLAPRWDLSTSRRGTIEINTKLANAIFDPEQRKELPSLFRDRVSKMTISKRKLVSPDQADLF
ncbi:hypothetical protein RYZ27_01260 [Hyphomonas sp. FCG-A18]|uniref:ORC-CDC6 family AAA ATPase n=1 Tax=Hyphomonas sp. FCG-A18 TaxID=3080019 RepID=UPI002B2B57ED|nr:hypothetical protein RYZ27_01260 [Hyphomonas sp. FCG-A18]